MTTQTAENLCPKLGPHLRFSLAHVWLWLTALTQGQRGCLNLATYSPDSTQVPTFFGPSLVFSTLSVSQIKTILGNSGNIWLTKPKFGSILELWVVSDPRSTCYCHNWVMSAKSCLDKTQMCLVSKVRTMEETTPGAGLTYNNKSAMKEWETRQDVEEVHGANTSDF